MATVTVENSNDVGSPGDGGSVFFIEGATPVTVNVDQSAVGADGLNVVSLAHPWVANVGTSGAPFKAEISDPAGSNPGLYNAAGGGTFFYEINGTANFCDLVRSYGPGTRRTVLQTTGTATVVECASGIIIVEEPVTAITVRIGGNGLVEMPDAASTDPTLVEIGGGSWVTERGAATVDQWGGTADVNAGTNTFGTYNLDGGVARWRQSGTITTLNWRSGIFDISKLGRELTITTLNVWANVNQNALHDLLRSHIATVTNVNYRMGNQ